MASTRRISYQWRMFIPMVLSLWLIIGGMAWWQIYRVKQTRISLIYDQLKFITSRIVALGENTDEIESFYSFINSYYSNYEKYDDISVQMADMKTRQIRNFTGPFISVEKGLVTGEHGRVIATAHGSNTPHEYLYYRLPTDDGRYVYVSFLPFTGKIAEMVTPVTLRFWLIMIGIGLFATAIAYISTGYVVSNINFLREFCRRATEGEDFVIDDSVHLPDDELGDISRDIINLYNQRSAEMARSEQEHKIAINAIEEKSRIKRELTANINHEIKTPIGIIKGYADTILADPEMPYQVQRKFVEKIQQNADRLTELIADITVITKYEHGEKLVTISDIDYHDLVYTFADELKVAEQDEKLIPFSFKVPLNCKISGNEALLRGMLANLVRNARLYSHGTMCHLQYDREDDDFYYFSFYDDGVGVPPEALPRLFERFFRLNQGRARSAGGTGLGLPIVKVTVESFGGSIEVENRIPSGLIFHFSLKKFKD